jgi:hypothetical protein
MEKYNYFSDFSFTLIVVSYNSLDKASNPFECMEKYYNYFSDFIFFEFFLLPLTTTRKVTPLDLWTSTTKKC